MIPKKPHEIFSYICHFIFAIVIATTYDTATHVFINSETPFLSNYDSLISSFELLLAYVAIISGWVGYSRSMLKWPHTDTKAGAFRFSLDIAVLFCYFGLITSTKPQNEFQDYFLYWIIALFILFSLWDLSKLKEYYEKNEMRRNNALLRSILKTFCFVLFFIIMYGSIPLLEEQEIGILTNDFFYIIVLLITIILLLLYRYLKWSVYLEPRTKKSTSSKKK